ncbi:MAG: NADH-quinone oxidoreductase subunit M [Candidatus Caenarcaniphilales bacterium]|nr:NADH-quinone oxidoreductase subunit M [Candidatus Caenarcaniphilales bacterium]
MPLPILSIILILCLSTAGIIGLIPARDRPQKAVADLCHWISLGSSLLILLLVSWIYFRGFDPSQPGLQFVESHNWYGDKIFFKLGIDGLSLSMIALQALLMPLVILASQPIAFERDPKLYYSLFFLLTAAVFGVFMAQDLMLFFVSWELELLPMYLLIARWGGQKRVQAANKFLLFTFLGGLFILAGILTLYLLSGEVTFAMPELGAIVRALQFQGALQSHLWLVHLAFILCAIGFCIKLPSIPVHTWLPEAHVEAPTPISMLLAGILLKMGAYGLIRFGLEFFPKSVEFFAIPLAVLGGLNILAAAIFALVQNDIKRVIAYSSISHMGFVLLGLASLNAIGLNGAIFQMFSHGLVSAGLFMVIGVIYERAHTREISQFSGLAQNMPYLFFLFLGLAMANLGLPALSGFIGESLVFYGIFGDLATSFNVKLAAGISTIGIIITAGYMLWLGRRLFFGEPLAKWSALTDIRPSEGVVLFSLLLFSLVLGSYPKSLNHTLAPNSENLIANLKPSTTPINNLLPDELSIYPLMSPKELMY